MRYLYVLRHAKAAESSRDGSDRARPLTSRGRRQAADMVGAFDDAVREGVPRPQLVLASAARRARHTAELVASGIGAPELRVESGLYQAHPDDVVERLRLLDDDVESVLVVGHNPTAHQLVLLLLAPDDIGAPDHFPTAALAVVELPVDRWPELGEATGRLLLLEAPRR